MPKRDATELRMVVGLGNPGRRYAETRHNVGFRTVERLAARLGVRLSGEECRAVVGGSPDVLLAMPQTYMNRSGYAVRCLAERHALTAERILVVYDEIALPLGRLRLRGGGSPGGHRGMESVVNNLRTPEVPRLRLGVGPREGSGTPDELTDYVLAPFPREERQVADEMIDRAVSASLAWLEEGLDVAMNRFNG